MVRNGPGAWSKRLFSGIGESLRGRAMTRSKMRAREEQHQRIIQKTAQFERKEWAVEKLSTLSTQCRRDCSIPEPSGPLLNVHAY